jgi:mannosyltransferase OCH1-like enzyme/glycosyltransferase involved in cell wall biosynthesis
MTTLPKIMHQIWIGDQSLAPINLMNTWKNKHPDFEYIFWNEDEFKKRGFVFECQDKIDQMSEINGKADIMRWEIIYNYGGVFLDADSICIEPFDDFILKSNNFAGFENEQVRNNLVATGTMGFTKYHPLCRNAINWILENNISVEETGNRAWKTVGPGLLTTLLETGFYRDVVVFPSYFFLPVHHSGITYMGHNKVYAYQEWGSTKSNYETMNDLELPDMFKEPTEWVSVLVSSYNTKFKYIQECIESIKWQNGHFGIELVWINDGSDDLNTTLLEKVLNHVKITTRFFKVVYKKMEENMGIGYCLHEGVNLCTNEIIIKMDSDDIMNSYRIKTQLEFMNTHSDCVLCGTNVNIFKTIQPDNQKQIIQKTTHKEVILWDEYKHETPYSHWIMNHSTLCYKKSAILSVGNYNKERSIFEDLELELKMLKKYEKIYNIQDPLVMYRIHEDQVTFAGKSLTNENKSLRNTFIEGLIHDDGIDFSERTL